MKRATINCFFSVQIPDSVDPNSITLDLDLRDVSLMMVSKNGEIVPVFDGKLTGFETGDGEEYEDEDDCDDGGEG